MTIHIVKPGMGLNLVANPSGELGTTGYMTDSSGGAISQSATYAYFGVYAIKAILGGSGTQNIKYTRSGMLTASTAYALTVRLRKSDGGVITGASLKLDTITLTTTITDVGGGWYELSGTGTTAGSISNHTCEIAGLTASGTYYADGFDLEAGSTIMTYCDGDQDGCAWNGVAHASTSSRSAMARGGGERVAIEDYVEMGQTLGIGTPALNVVSTPFGLAGGAVYQRSVRQARAFSLVGAIQGSSVANLHLVQRQLFDLLKPDLVAPQQPMVIEYTAVGTGKRVRIRSVYDGGMEFETQIGGSLMEKAPLRFIAHDPLWYEEKDSGAVLGFTLSVANANYILQRTTSGTWQAMGTGMNGAVRCLAVGPDGCLYAGGEFTQAGGVTVNGIAKWNGSAWSALGGGVSSGTVAVYALALNAAGILYAGGGFSLMGGASNTVRIAQWNGSAWSALGTGGANDDIYALAIGPLGELYAGGAFSSIGGVAAAAIAQWYEGAWNALGSGLDDDCFALAIRQSDGMLYLGGDFAHAGGNVAAYIASYNIYGGTWSALGTGIDNSVLALALGPGGELYAGGAITGYIAQWNGSAWSALGGGVNGLVYALTLDSSGRLVVGGLFYEAGGISVNELATWNGSVWFPPDLALPGASPVLYIYALLASQQYGLFIGFDHTQSPTAGVTTTVTNGGSADAHPVIQFTGPGTLVQLGNYTTGDSLWFNLRLAAGETATLDLTPGAISFTSNFRGNIIGTILPGSNLATWTLAPGANAVSCFITGSTGATKALLWWRNAHWSADGVQ